MKLAQPVPVRKLLNLTFLILLAIFSALIIVKPKTADAHLYEGKSSLDHGEAIPEQDLLCGSEDENPNTPPTYVTNIRDPEFHSLRPYQAARCGDSDKTLFCKNTFKIVELIPNRWSPACVKDPSGQFYLCPPPPGFETITKTYVIDEEGAKFPIMGNTEQVRNSQQP